MRFRNLQKSFSALNRLLCSCVALFYCKVMTKEQFLFDYILRCWSKKINFFLIVGGTCQIMYDAFMHGIDFSLKCWINFPKLRVYKTKV